MIILACIALHNFIRESAVADADFEAVESDENFMPSLEWSRQWLNKVDQTIFWEMRIKT